MRKFLAVLAAMLLIMTVFAGCGDSKDSGDAAGQETDGATAAADLPEGGAHVTINAKR